MEAILAGLVNLGLGGIMGAALVWFLHHLVTRTLPEMTRTFHEEVRAERDQRKKEQEALLGAIARLGQHHHEEYEVLLDRLDFGFQQMVNETSDNRAVLERHLQGSPSSPAGPAPGSPRPRQ